jgi:hypothetical protein
MKNIASLNLSAKKERKKVAFLPRSTSHYQFAHWAKCGKKKEKKVAF